MRRTKLIFIIAAAVIIIIIVFWLKTFRGARVKEESYKIGVLTPLTGPWATYGASTKKGVDFAIEEINSMGGINGVKITVIYEDTKGEPKEALNGFNKLVNIDKVSVIIGAFRSAETMAVAPQAEKKKVILFSASSTADEIKYAGDFIFRNVPSNSGQGKSAANFVINYLGKKSSVILYQNDDYGQSLADAFEKEFKLLGGEIIYKEAFEGGRSDFRSTLIKIKSKRHEVIYFPGNYPECARILKQAKELNLNSIFIGGDGAYSPDLITIAGEAAEGTYYTLMSLGYGISDRQIDQFKNSFLQKYREEPDVYAAYAYDAAKIIAEAIKSGGISSEKIKNELYKMHFIGVTGITKFDAYGEVNKPYYIYEVKNKKFKLVDLALPFNQ